MLTQLDHWTALTDSLIVCVLLLWHTFRILPLLVQSVAVGCSWDLHDVSSDCRIASRC